MRDEATEPAGAPTACDLSRAAIYEVAESASALLDLRPDADLADAVRRLGGTISFVPRTQVLLGGDDCNASLEVHRDLGFEIRVPDDVGRRQRRFLIAHELGHLVLHYPPLRGKTMRAWQHGEQAAEREADWFAAALLMPPTAFRKAYGRLHGLGVDLADEFGASLVHVRRHCTRLGLVCH